MINYFVDSNFFLQFRDPAELPWSDVTPDDDIQIFVPRTVQREIDRLKHSGNSRQARKARKVTGLFRKVIDSADLRHIVSEPNPRVTIAFPPRVDPDWERPAQLDLNHPDDRIVAEMLAYASACPESEVRLLTNDTHQMLTARNCELPFTAVPDSWLLPPEPDGRDKRIAELDRRLAALEKGLPEIKVDIFDGSDAPVTRLDVDVSTFQKLTAEQVEQLVAEAKTQHPMAEPLGNRDRSPSAPKDLYGIDFSSFGSHSAMPIVKKIRHYQETEYPNWVAEIRAYYTNVHSKLGQTYRRVSICFVLRNEGSRPAENLLIEFEASSGLVFLPNRRQEEDDDIVASRLALPEPPVPPAQQHTSAAERLQRSLLGGHYGTTPIPDLFGLTQNHHSENDRHAFYYKEGGSRLTAQPRRSLTCEEFRHKVDPEYFELQLFVPPDVTVTKAAVTCRVTATNLPDPFLATFPVTIAYMQKDTYAESSRQAR